MLILIITVVTAVHGFGLETIGEPAKAMVSGDIILGGLFPMHEHNVTQRDYPCGAVKEEKGIQVRRRRVFNFLR